MEVKLKGFTEMELHEIRQVIKDLETLEELKAEAILEDLNEDNFH